MRAYYNDFDKGACAWLRELIKRGCLPEGDVDERSICEVQPGDLAGYTQCHFFAGIGGWPYALQLAGWPADRPVWSGSCPCQPFSCAGKGKGTEDERHLWPEFYRLIGECKPATVFGEQVASKAGREWLTGVLADLEALGYAGAGGDLCAAGIGAPHIRQRLWWVADSARERLHGRLDRYRYAGIEAGGADGGVQHAKGDGWEQRGAESGEWGIKCGRGVGYWDAFDILPFRDGKARRVEPGTFPLAHGVSARVGRLRGYGNAIVPQVAAEFIAAYMEAERELASM